MSLQQGSIIWATVADQAGRNPKCRPAVVVTPTHEISADDTFVVVAATGTFSNPLPDNRVELPWQAGGHPATGLYKRCVAVCDWLAELNVADVVSVGCVVPPAVLNRILDKLPSDSE